MKRLQLKVKDLTNPTILNHREIKNIMGGVEGSGGCTDGGEPTCKSWYEEGNGTVRVYTETWVHCSEAKAGGDYFASIHTRGGYCCDSCPQL
jgi:hypothetical protein